MFKSFTRVSRTKKEHRRSIARVVLKGGLRESAAKGRARECTWRSFPIPRTRAYVCVCTLRRLRNARTFFILPRDLSHKVTAMCASLSFFYGKTVGIRDMCVPTHVALVVHAREDARGNPCGVWKESPNAGGRRTVGSAKGGKTRQGWEDDRTYAVHGRHKAANPWEYRACASPARGLHELYGLFFLHVLFFFLKPPAALCTHDISARARRFLFQHVAALRGLRHGVHSAPNSTAKISVLSLHILGM